MTMSPPPLPVPDLTDEEWEAVIDAVEREADRLVDLEREERDDG